MAAKRLCSSFW